MRAWSESMELDGAGTAKVLGFNRRRYVKLSDVKSGQRCTVIRLETGAVERVRRLVALGVMPGSLLEISQTWPAIVFRMGFSEFAVDAELAATIVVQVE